MRGFATPSGSALTVSYYSACRSAASSVSRWCARGRTCSPHMLVRACSCIATRVERLPTTGCSPIDAAVRVVVNTHAHADHFGSNELMAEGGAIIVGHDELRARMVSGQYLAAFNQTVPPSRPAALPKMTFAGAMTIHFDGDTVELIHVPNAHTDNDTLVRFVRANVIHASGTTATGGGSGLTRRARSAGRTLEKLWCLPGSAAVALLFWTSASHSCNPFGFRSIE